MESFILWVIVIFIYLIPAVVANCRNHSNQISIFIVDLFFGWTLIGWVACLAWAYSDNVKIGKNDEDY